MAWQLRIMLGLLVLIFILSGCSIFMGNRAPVAIIEAHPTRGDAPLVVEFDSSRSFDPDGIIVLYRWDFGDGSRAEGQKVSHTYQRNGVYLATLQVSDQLGASDHDRVRIVVGNAPPQAIFTASPAGGWRPLTVSFDGSASFDPEGERLTYEWDFGDGAQARGSSVTHTYLSAGRFRVQLRVTDREGDSSTATLTISVLDFMRLRSMRVGPAPIDVVLHDFDDDGVLDLAIASSEGHEVSLLFGRLEAGSFAFTEGVRLGVGRRPVDLIAADLNGDGRMDLATANLDFGSVSLILNGGHRSFRLEELRIGRWASAITAADFDGDERIDLAVADAEADRVVLLLGSEEGFIMNGSIPVGRWPAALASGDFNSDSFVDLAVANFLDDSITLLLGDGLGGFHDARVIKVGAGPVDLSPIDLNGDDRLDLVVANLLGASLSVFFAGRGDLTLTTEIKVGEGARALAVGDFDGDGSSDLAAASSSNNTVTVLLNDGLGRFAPARARDFPATGNPSALATGDLDQDGFLDLVIMHFSAGRLSIWLNQL